MTKCACVPNDPLCDHQKIYTKDVQPSYHDGAKGYEEYHGQRPPEDAEEQFWWNRHGTAEMHAKWPLLPMDAAVRKSMPIARGVLDYFPRAIAYVAHVSHVSTEQHHPGEPLHWDMNKSTDEADCIARHLIERGRRDPKNNLRHSGYLAWRGLANLERELIEAEKNGEPML